MYTGRLLTSLKEERQKQTHTVCKIICGAERTETKAFDTDRVSVEIYTYYALSPIQIRNRHNHTNMIAAMCNAPYVMCYQKKNCALLFYHNHTPYPPHTATYTEYEWLNCTEIMRIACASQKWRTKKKK